MSTTPIDLAKNSKDIHIKTLLEMYTLFLEDHDLDNDTNSITVENLVTYIDEQIDEKEQEQLVKRLQLKYE